MIHYSVSKYSYQFILRNKLSKFAPVSGVMAEHQTDTSLIASLAIKMTKLPSGIFLSVQAMSFFLLLKLLMKVRWGEQ